MRDALLTAKLFSDSLNFFTCSLPKITLNDRTVHVKHNLSWGVNVENAAHPCVVGPCTHGGSCRPQKEGYECDCPLGFEGLHCQKGTLGGSGPASGARGRTDCGWTKALATPGAAITVVFINDFSDIVGGQSRRNHCDSLVITMRKSFCNGR